MTFVSKFLFIKMLNGFDRYKSIFYILSNFGIPIFIFYLVFNNKNNEVLENNTILSYFKKYLSSIPLVFLIIIYLYFGNFISNLLVINSSYMNNLIVGLIKFVGLYSGNYSYIRVIMIISYIFCIIFFTPFIIIAYKYFIKNLKIHINI